MANDSDDSLEFDFSSLDLNDFDLGMDMNEEENVKTDSSAEEMLNGTDSLENSDSSEIMDSLNEEIKDVINSDPDILSADQELLNLLGGGDALSEEKSSDTIKTENPDDFGDLFSLLGMGDMSEQELFSSMMDSIPDSDDEKKTNDSENDDVEDIDESLFGSSMNNIYSDVLGAVGSLEDKEKEEQLLNELDGIEEKTNTKKKEKKGEKKKKEKQPKEKVDLSVMLFGEEDPETEEEIVAREKKEADRQIKREAKQKKQEEKKQLAQEKKKIAKEEAAIRKQKELENMDPEDLKPLNKKALMISICIFLCIAIFVIVATPIFHYSLNINKASDYFERRKYDMAYEKMIGVDIKEKDVELRDKIYTVMYVESANVSYNTYVDMGSYEKALHTLLTGLEKYDKYYSQGRALGIEEDMEYCRNRIINTLRDAYGISIEEAYELLTLDDDEYQVQIIEKSKSYKKN